MAGTPDADSPSDIVVADLSSCSISSIAAPNSQPSNQQLSLCSFTNLAALDLSDNRLACFAGLAVLPSLQQLHLSANRLRSLQGMLQPSETAQHTRLSSAGQAGVSHGSRRSSASTVTGGHWHEVQQGSSQAGDQGSDQEGGSQEQTDAATVASQGDNCMQEESMGLVVQQPEQQQHDGELLAPAGQQCQDHEQGAAEHSCSETAPSTTQLSCPSSSPSLMLCGFGCLEVLDVSYNLLSGEQLLGQGCPLGLLPRQACATDSSSSSRSKCMLASPCH
jgi:Leucine-rich repeat (LRR) protein